MLFVSRTSIKHFFVFIIVMDVSDILIVGDVNILFQKYYHPQKDPKVSWKRKKGGKTVSMCFKMEVWTNVFVGSYCD